MLDLAWTRAPVQAAGFPHLYNVSVVDIEEANIIDHGLDSPAKHALSLVDGAILLDLDSGCEVQAARVVGRAGHCELISAPNLTSASV